VRTSHAARTSTSSWRLPQSNIISADGQARDFSYQNGESEEQETSVDLALKLPQTCRSQLRRREAKDTILRL
jgi:hypothetical protein